MTICFVCGEYPPLTHGGIGTITRVLGSAAARAGHEVRVVGVVPPGSTVPPYEERDGVRVWRLVEPPRWRGGWVAGRYALCRQVRRWSQRGEIDLVEVPDWQGWAAGWPALRVPVIARLHGSMSYFAREVDRPVSRMAFRLERASLRRADFISSTSEYTRRRTADLFGLTTAAVVLLNPVESIDVRGTPLDGRVVFTGTLTAKKGVLSLMDAWESVAAACPEAELHCYGRDGSAAGSDSMQGAMIARVSPSARARLHFHGHVTRPTVIAALATASVAVFPSYAEAFAMAPLEALAVGCATVSTTRGSGPEQFVHERHGLLVDPADTPRLAAAIVELLRDRPKRERLARAGREWVRERYDLASLLSANLSFYEQCRADFVGRRAARGMAHDARPGPRAA